ncbi:MAG: GMC family oxidoreductase [Deltaproteobacteria bacterium]|nr:GMC family oxidoreductase [Deltaproteobacteria bacterium]
MCVVGSGPAGAVLGASLAVRGQKVVLLEHGPRLGGLSTRREVTTELAYGDLADRVPEHLRQEIVAPSPASGQPYANAQVGAVGGSSVRWAAFCPRPHPEDLATHTRFGHGRDWPFPYEVLEPWLGRAERALGVSGEAPTPYGAPRSGPFPMPRLSRTELEARILAPAVERLGLTIHGQPVAVASVPAHGRPACERCGVCSACPTGARYSADLVHVPRVETAASGLVLPLIHARRLELDRRGERVLALHAVQTDRPEDDVIVRAERFVLAAGAIETTRLLLLSRDHPRHGRGVGNHSGQLGLRFTDHAFLGYQFVVREPVGWGAPVYGVALDAFRRPAERDRRGAFHFVFVPGAHERLLVDRVLSAGRIDIGALRAQARGSFVALATAELEGAGGRLALDTEIRDAFGDPLARIEIPLTAADEASFMAVDGFVRRLAGAVHAQTLEPMSVRGGFVWGAHPMGSCAMASDPEHGVVDPSLQVFGVANLFVVGSAVFPHFGSANPTLTVVALALRLAARLGAELDDAGARAKVPR